MKDAISPKRTSLNLPLVLLAMLVTSSCLNAAESLQIGMKDGTSMNGQVVKITKSDVTLKINDIEQTLPLDLLDPKKGVLLCYKAAGNKFDATLRKDMGTYFLKKKLYDEAEEELVAAV